ncbi:MAG: hypothetical protein Q7R71_00170 [bacterium]|nr:hypothetical protein [bacterium]
MTTATLEKRVRSLEAEVKLLKSAVARPRASTTKSKKKLPRWLQASLKDVEEGRVSGPFNSVKELMHSLES